MSPVGRPNHPTYPTERSCVNCTRSEVCWTATFLAHALMPLHDFVLRNEWNSSDFINYSKRNYGSVCGNFQLIPGVAMANGSVIQFGDMHNPVLMTKDKEWED